MNRRIRKKRNCPYIQLKKCKPGDVTVFEFDVYAEDFDLENAFNFFKAAVKTLPYQTSVILMPNFISFKSEDKEAFRKCLDKAEEFYNSL